MIDALDLSLLKTITSNKKNALHFANECDPKLFSADVWNFANIVFNYIKMYKEVPTLRTLSEKLNKKSNEPFLDNVKKIWKELDSIVYDDKEYKHDLDKIRKRYREKQVISLQTTLSKVSIGDMDVDKVISDIHKSIKSLDLTTSHGSFESKSIKDYLPYFVEKFKARRSDPNFDAGLKTGYNFLDKSFKCVAADFILIAGESGFGKSLFLNNIAIQTWMQKHTTNSNEYFDGKNILYFSLEMPYEDCFNRLLARLSGVEIRVIENPLLISKDQSIKLKKAMDFIDRYPYEFKIVDLAGDVRANDIEAIIEDQEIDYDAYHVDYLGIMSPNDKSTKSDWENQGVISHELRSIARRRAKPIFSAVQLNRKAAGKDSSDNIGLSRLARSATIATHATQVIQIENRQNEESYPDFIYHIIKNRKGKKGKSCLIKNLSCATLLDNDVDDYNFEDISERLADIDF